MNTVVFIAKNMLILWSEYIRNLRQKYWAVCDMESKIIYLKEQWNIVTNMLVIVAYSTRYVFYRT